MAGVKGASYDLTDRQPAVCTILHLSSDTCRFAAPDSHYLQYSLGKCNVKFSIPHRPLQL
jgi:hypothetical protein